MTAPVKIVILQHPSEQKHPLATVPILKACLSELDVHVGTQFNPKAFSELNLNKCRVLFPADEASEWSAEGEPSLDASEIEALFVLDGTWRKAKRIWFENTWLQQIPAVSLQAKSRSDYRIRSTSIEGGLSTLESVVLASNILAHTQDYNVLLKPFKEMVDMQIKKMGIETFNAHYKGQSD